MGRNSKSRQQSSSSSSHAANELLNFRFSAPVVDRQDSASSRNQQQHSRGSSSNRNNRRSNNNNHNHNRQSRNYARNSQNNRRTTAQDRAGARRKADSSMFYLHSSSEHSFFLSRRSPSKVNKEMYVFNGVDEGVSWDSVRTVEQRVPTGVCVASDPLGPCCPICLCDYVCPRITKCGHSFCLSCILRHMQTYKANNPYHHVKCPCCGIPVVLDDLRPVSFEMVVPPAMQSKFRLRKLHRTKQSSAPFLPLPEAPMHGNPHFCPTAKVDPDAKYSRFNFVDSDYFHSILVENQMELQREISSSVDDAEKVYLGMALEIVMTQQQHAIHEREEEETLCERYAKPTAGMYLPQSPALVYSLEDLSPQQQEQLSAVAEEWWPPGEDSMACVRGASTSLGGRYRGDSIGSYKSVESAATHSSNHSKEDVHVVPTSPGGTLNQRKPQSRPQGSMYLDESSAVHFYQSEDGQLVFLNGFNMACLLSDYAKGLSQAGPKTQTFKAPLPDFIEGRVLEIENVQLTPDLRKRMPFLSHLPVFSDVSFVELDLNSLLSEETRKKFKADISKRRKQRQARIQAEKRADKAAEREETDRINERKARLQTIDPDDDFFQIQSLPQEPQPTTGEDFGPSLVSGNESGDSAARHQRATNTGSMVTFSAAARRGADPISISSTEAFPALGAASEAFPALVGPGSRPTTVDKPAASASGAAAPATPSVGTVGKKKYKGKQKKILLFSTAGGRAY